VLVWPVEVQELIEDIEHFLIEFSRLGIANVHEPVGRVKQGVRRGWPYDLITLMHFWKYYGLISSINQECWLPVLIYYMLETSFICPTTLNKPNLSLSHRHI